MIGKTERNNKIFERYNTTRLTYGEIGKEFNISGERARQIINRLKLKGGEKHGN